MPGLGQDRAPDSGSGGSLAVRNEQKGQDHLSLLFNKIDNYIHDIYTEENSDTFEITGFEIQTTSYGALKTEEIEKVVEGYNIAIKTVKELEKIFL